MKIDCKLNLSVRWKVYERSGEEIDRIETELREIFGFVDRTEWCNGNKFDAVYHVRGLLNVGDLIEACGFMDGVKAYPV